MRSLKGFKDWWKTREMSQKGIIFVNLINMTVCYIVGWGVWGVMVGFLLAVIATLDKLANRIALPSILISYIVGPILFALAYADPQGSDDWEITSRRLANFSAEFGAVALSILITRWMAK
jgi:hypothetical protein